MKDMEKTEVREDIGFNLNWTGEAKIAEMKQDLEALERIGATHIEIEAYDNYGSPSLSIKVCKYRMETEKEFLSRKLRFLEKKERTKQMELEQLEKLKAKYGL